MARILDGDNLNTPFFVDDYGYVDVSVSDFDPVTTLTDWKYPDGTMHESRLGSYTKNGFLVRCDTAGVLQAITLRQFKEAIKHPAGDDDATILATLVPEPITLTANQWLECRLIKVFAATSSAELDLLEDINVGTLL